MEPQLQRKSNRKRPTKSIQKSTASKPLRTVPSVQNEVLCHTKTDVDSSLMDRRVLAIDRTLLNYENEERRKFGTETRKSTPTTDRDSRTFGILIPPRPHFKQLLIRAGSALDLGIIDEDDTICHPQEEQGLQAHDTTGYLSKETGPAQKEPISKATCVRMVYGRRATRAEYAMIEAASSGHPEALAECLHQWPTHPGTLLLLALAEKHSGHFGDAMGRVGLYSFQFTPFHRVGIGCLGTWHWGALSPWNSYTFVCSL